MPRATTASTRPISRLALGEETRAALIDAATAIFIEQGLRAARVDDIARRAGQRLSAISYHFGGKENLYLAVLGHHAELALANAPLHDPDPAAPLRQRFGFAVQAIVTRVLGQAGGSQIGPLMLREMVSPTPALQMLIERFMLPQAGQLRALLTEALGADVETEQLSRVLVSVFGQCVVYVTARPAISRLMPELYAGDALVERIANHVAAFSWAGIQALRETIGENR